MVYYNPYYAFLFLWSLIWMLEVINDKALPLYPGIDISNGLVWLCPCLHRTTDLTVTRPGLQVKNINRCPSHLLYQNCSGKRGAASNTMMFLCGGRLPMTTQNIWTTLAWMKPSFGICSLMSRVTIHPLPKAVLWY